MEAKKRKFLLFLVFFLLPFLTVSQLTNIPNMDTSNVTNMQGIFADTNIQKCENFDAYNCTDLSSGFNYCRSLKSITNLKVSNKMQSLSPFLNTLGKIRADLPKKKPSEIVEAIIRYYRPILKDKYDDFNKREKDLDHFEYLSTQYSNLEDFISDLALEPPDASVEGMYKNNSDDEALTISTIHSAKGLEWDSVFIIGAVDGRFPSAYSLIFSIFTAPY